MTLASLTPGHAHVRANTAAFGAVLALALINLLLWPYETPPLIDWPNHLARHILQCQAPGAEAIAAYYDYALEVVPNLASDLVHTLALACQDVALTQKLLIQVSTTGMVIATFVLHRAIFGVFSAWPALSGLIMHHMAWSYGFENFVVAVPFALGALAIWFFLSGYSLVLRTLVLLPVMCGIYVLHLYAFGFVFLAVSALEIDRAWRGATGRARGIASTGLSIALLAAVPAWHMGSALEASPEIQTTLFGHGGLSTLWMTVTSPFVPFGDASQSLESAVPAILTLCGGVGLVLGQTRFGYRIRIDPRVARILPFLLLVCLVAPYNFSGVYYSNIRLPVLTLALLIAGTRIELDGRRIWPFVSIVLLLVVAKTGWISGKWAVHDMQVADLRQAGAVLSETDRIIVVQEDFTPFVRRHAHSTAYLLLDHGMYWRGLFTGGNSLSPRAEYQIRDHTQPVPFDWRVLGPAFAHYTVFADGGQLHEWSEYYTHALLLFDPDGAKPDASPLGEVVRSGTFFDLYRIAPKEAQQWP